jgi:hypothetical protein
MGAALLLTGAHKPQPPTGDLVLDAVNPVIEVEIQKVPMRLRVDLDRQDSIELNPASAARLPLIWSEGGYMDVGRVRLVNHVASALLTVDGKNVPVELSRHGRDCCSGVDGVIGPDLLPFATVHWRNATAPAMTASQVLLLDADPNFGLSAASDAGDVRIHFSFDSPETVATAAAGATLAQLWGGHWSGPEQRVNIAFAIARPARPMAFAHPGLVAGFPLSQVLVRLSDFAGKAKLPTDPDRAGEIVVAHRLEPQRSWSVVKIGTDRLSRCAEVVYTAIPRSLTLYCAFPSS